MPAQKHTKKANTPQKQRQWAHVRESEIAAGKTPGEADKIANGVIKKATKKTTPTKATKKTTATKKTPAPIANTGPIPFKVTAKNKKPGKK